MTDTATRTSDPLMDELTTWLEDNWDPDLTVAQWWDRLGNAGWSSPLLPENAYGRGLSRTDSVRVAVKIGEFGALGAPAGLGLLLAAPTIADHGTQEQIDLYVREIVTGQKAWCQLFSEPGAGSDLAGLNCKAIEDGEEWIFNGQKVWTSGGQIADMGMLIARSDPEVPKHQGISYWAIDMHQPGIDIRPLKEMTGRAMFNEVFLTDAVAPADSLIGGKNNGWAVANTTLTNERAGLGAGGGGAVSRAQPGTVAGMLDKRAGDFVKDAPDVSKKKASDQKPKTPRLGLAGSAKMLHGFATNNGKDQDATVRQDLIKLHTLAEIGRYNSLRAKAARQSGTTIAGMPNMAKLGMSDILRLQRDLGMRILGPLGTLHAYTSEDKKALDAATGNPFTSIVTETALMAQGPPIYGGTDQIQRNIIGERVLGLPKEPNNDRTTAFKDLPKNG